MRIKQSLLLSCALMAASGAAIAQAPPAPTTPPAQTAPPAPARSNNCSPSPPEHVRAGGSTESLGDKLAKSDGVLCPPAGVDPEMRAPTPEGGNTPVIPPPGSPGGDPSIRPK
jgi:hypothetical protein